MLSSGGLASAGMFDVDQVCVFVFVLGGGVEEEKGAMKPG